MPGLLDGARLPAHVPLLASTRGNAGAGIVECLHHGSIAIVDDAGRLVAGAGDPDGINFTRSTLKPFQALPFVEEDGLARLGFGSQELALMCASHNGESVHVALARRILERVDARPADLQCGAQEPHYYAATGTHCPPALVPGPLHHNCSGKHSGFLAYCRLCGHGLATYLDPDAPLQVRVRNAVQRHAAGPLVAGTDGCSAPNFALPLRQLAGLYGKLACAADPALRALFYAMTRHPDLVSGTARTDLALTQMGAGSWVAKVGADGLQALGLRDRGLGIAIRIADGNMAAVHAVTAEVLHQIGLLDEPARSPIGRHFRPAQRNARGTITGRLQPLFRLPRLFA